MLDSSDVVFLVSNANFADALSVSSPAAIMNTPILYINSNGTLPKETKEALKELNCSKIFTIGGYSAVHPNAEGNYFKIGITENERLYGSDRYGTSLDVYDRFSHLFESNSASVATGKNFPDALAGAALSAKIGMPLFLVGNNASKDLINIFDQIAPETVYAFGGDDVVPDSIISACLSGNGMTRPTTITTTAAPTTTTTTTTTTAATATTATTTTTTTTASTTTTTAPTTTAAPSASFEKQVLNLVNAERAKEGVAPLSGSNTALNAAASMRAEELTALFDHIRPNGRSCFTALDEYGVSYWTAGENIAIGQMSPAQVMNSWMNSTGHRENILNPNFSHIGIGCVSFDGVYYWVQMFIG